MNLILDAQGNVQKINELLFAGKSFTITFIDGTSHYIRGLGHVTQQLAHIPFLTCPLQEALQLTYAIAKALGEGPIGSGPNHVKFLSAKITNRFHLNFLDTGIQLYDQIEFFNDSVRYVNEGGPQLSELGDLSQFNPPLMTKPITIALVAPAVASPSTIKAPSKLTIAVDH